MFLYKAILYNREHKFKDSQDIILKNNLIIQFKNNNIFLLKLLELESKNYEKLELFLKAYNKVAKRNNIITNLPETKNFNRNDLIESISKYKIFYNKRNVEHITNRISYPDDSKLVFLVGFPRSGTTLLDTILRTHTKIKVLEEQPYLINIRHKYFNSKNNDLTAIKNISQSQVNYLRKSYYNKIITSAEDRNKIIVDKFPLSIIELGFIKTIFPSSKILLAMRHPGDVITSCFFSSFKINEAMVNFLSIRIV